MRTFVRARRATVWPAMVGRARRASRASRRCWRLSSGRRRTPSAVEPGHVSLRLRLLSRLSRRPSRCTPTPRACGRAASSTYGGRATQTEPPHVPVAVVCRRGRQHCHNVQSSGSAISTSHVAGIFTYTMTCSGGGLVSQLQRHSGIRGRVPDVVADGRSVTAGDLRAGTCAGQPRAEPAVDVESRILHDRFYRARGQHGCEPRRTVSFGHGHGGRIHRGRYEYQLFCPGAPIARTSIEWVTANPRITLTAESAQNTGAWIAGYQYQLFWTSNTVPCTASGGVPGDGWAGSKGNSVHAAQTVTAPTAPGTYTYSLTCGSGTSIGARIDPHRSTTRGHIDYQSREPVHSPVRDAAMELDGLSVHCERGWSRSELGRQTHARGDRRSINQTTPGTYTNTISCGSGAQTVSASAQVTFRAGDPTVLNASATSVPVNTPVTLSWESGSNSCTAVGGIEGDGWGGVKPPSGSMIVTSLTAQPVGYALNCAVGGKSVVVTYTGVSGDSPSASRPTATLSASQVSQAAGQPITLRWDSRNANACFAAGGSSGDGWAGSISLSGTMTITNSNVGSATYSITCTSATPAATAQTKVTFVSPPGTGAGSNGGRSGGGGGALDGYSALLIMLMGMTRIWRPRFPRRIWRGRDCSRLSQWSG